MTPLQVLEAKYEWVRRYKESEFFQKYMKGVFGPRVTSYWADRLTRATLLAFEEGEAYRVTKEMADLVTFAASKLDSSDKFDRSLAPTPYGVVRFDKPLPIWDQRGMLMLASWMTWTSTSLEVKSRITGKEESRPGMFITWWNDTVTNPDQIEDVLIRWFRPQDRMKVKRQVGRWGFIAHSWMEDGHRLGDSLIHTTPEQIKQALEDDEYLKEELRSRSKRDLFKEGLFMTPPPPTNDYTNTSRYTHALWLLLNQTIVDTREEVFSRAAAKRIGRMPIPGTLTVINLRRREHRPSLGETYVEWQHRWVVRGHWRWQPYSDGTTKRIWIHPFIKGPEGKPFKQTVKVYNFKE